MTFQNSAVRSTFRFALITMALVMLASHSRAGAVNLEPIIRAAKRATARDQHVKACELYLGVIPGLAKVSDRDRLRVLRGLHETVQALVAKGLLDAAVDGLIGLLQATSGENARLVPGVEFAQIIRTQMDHLGFELLRKDNPELAARLLRALVADGPSPPLRWALLARATMRSGEFKKAQDTIKRGLSVYPGSPELLFSRADLSGYLSQRAVMRSNYKAAEHLLLRAHRDLDHALEREKAAGIYRAMGRICASLWNYYSATGQYELAMARLDEAEEAYGQAALLDSSDTNSLFELGDLLVSARDYRWARKVFSQACKRIKDVMKTVEMKSFRNKIYNLELSRCKRKQDECTKHISKQVLAYANTIGDGYGQEGSITEGPNDTPKQIPNTSVSFSMVIGQLDVHAALPPFMDPGEFRVKLEKAYAITMVAFPNRLVGPLDVKVFADRNSFTRLVGMPVRHWLNGVFAYGKVLTFYDPTRGRMSWLETLVGGLTFRYVDEMTYHNSPSWLSDGLAQHIALGWDSKKQQEFDQLSKANALIPWSNLDDVIDGTWSSKQARTNAHLQAHQMVGWLYGHFGEHRIWTFLAQLRGGRSLDSASSVAFGNGFTELEELWRRDAKDAI